MIEIDEEDYENALRCARDKEGTRWERYVRDVLIPEVKAAECEACAKIADSFAKLSSRSFATARDPQSVQAAGGTAIEIARYIRARSSEGNK